LSDVWIVTDKSDSLEGKVMSKRLLVIIGRLIVTELRTSLIHPLTTWRYVSIKFTLITA